MGSERSTISRIEICNKTVDFSVMGLDTVVVLGDVTRCGEKLSCRCVSNL